ncbi:MAG TPA: amino acid adenylation domain-containing protein, partial [Longimicrobiaceae bacterium]
EGTERVLPEVDPRSAAYVIYTSGSTGRPKGVVVEHEAIAAQVGQLARAMEPIPEDRMLHSASAGFDVAMEQLFLPLAAGAAIVLSGPEPWSPAEFPRKLRELGVTHAEAVPAYWQEVAETAEPIALPGLRFFQVGSDAVPSATIPRWRAAFPGPTRMVNGYGPTETVVTATQFVVPEGYPGAYPGAVVPVGRPLPGRTAYVLDRAGSPAPAGVPGELYLGGPLVARGYLGRPDLTAEKFVPDPFGGEPGARLYRTGDRVRWLAGGDLEFLGRTDAQVKIRGFRVEPGEVEAALLEHPSVREAAVVAREGAPGDRRLVGYVAAAPGHAVDRAALREHLRRLLPEHMVPAALVELDSFPRTSSGKTDRRALPAPEWGEDGASAAPRTAAEEILAGIFAEVLKRERVGVHQGFWELGGHSLLATRVVSRVRDALGVELPLRALFEAPTAAGLAERVEALLREGEGVQAPPLAPVPRGGPLPASFAQQRLWFVQQMDPGSAAYNMPSALRLRGRLDVGALERAFSELARRHETLRTVFAVVDGEPVQVVREPSPVVLPVADLRALPPEGREAEALRLAREEALRPFDLGADALLRARLLRLGDDEWALLLVLHHVVSDGWSAGILVGELSALYAGSPLPPLPVQYADYAAWQREYLSGETLERQLAWWRERLAGAPPLLELPVDRPRRLMPGAQGAHRAFALTPETTRALRELSRREGATLFMTLLAAWQLLLARWSGQDDVSVGTPVAGRDRVEVEGLIGFFVNTLVLRADLAGDPSFRAHLRRVREGTLGAYAHQEVPFEKLVEELAPERSLTHTPFFQVMFSFQNTEQGVLSLGELELEPLGSRVETARFDLSLGVAEDGERLFGWIMYRAELFDAATVDRMLGHYARLLESVAADDARRVLDYPLLDDAERERVLVEWNATDAAFPEDACVHHLFEAQARRTPGAPAVVSDGACLTYAGLDALADGLALRLAARGVGPDARVGLFVERSADAVVAVLGILKAGGAYLALDPSYPDERLLFMLEDSGARVLVTHSALEGRLGAFGGPRVEVGAEEPGEGSLPDVSPHNLAYVIYTSGSTGTPKGVLVEHRSVVNYLHWFDRAVLGGEDFAIPLVSRLSFDAHVRQLFPPLLRGGAAWVLPEDTATDPAALLEAVSGRGNVAFGGVPSLWGAMLERVRSGEAERPEGVRAVMLGGEALGAELAERTLETFPDAALWNHYGPTEATVNISAARVRSAGHLAIGRPVANARVYLLDRGLGPVPVGVAGELYVGGAGVARGYLGRPDLTAERFVPDP